MSNELLAVWKSKRVQPFYVYISNIVQNSNIDFSLEFLKIMTEIHLLTHSIEAHKTQCTVVQTLRYAMQSQCISWFITTDLLQGSDSPCWPKIGIFASS